MQIAGTSGGSALQALQSVFHGARHHHARAGQEVPSTGQDGTGQSVASSTGSGGPQMGSQMMAAVLGLQTQQQPSDSDVANQLIKSLDSDGDGKVSLGEIQSAFQQAGIDTDASTAFGKVDSDGDGQISADELTSAVGSSRAQHAGGPPPGGPPPGGPPPGGGGGGPPSASDAASSATSAYDTDGDDGLSLKELASALGEDDSSSDDLSSTFGSLDTNGDGVLSADELATAIQTKMQEAQRAYAARLGEQTDASQIAASA